MPHCTLVLADGEAVRPATAHAREAWRALLPAPICAKPSRYTQRAEHDPASRLTYVDLQYAATRRVYQVGS
jgi:hypothetical protein